MQTDQHDSTETLMEHIRLKASQNLAHNIPFVCYAKPDSNQVIGLFQRTAETIAFDPEAAGFCMVSFDGTNQYLIPDTAADCYFEQFSPTDFLWNPVAPSIDPEIQQQFENLVAKAIQAIATYDFQKVVLSRKEIQSATPENPFTVFERLLALYPSAFRYLWYHPQTGIWLGATPEQLLQKTDQSLTTVALAGTQVAATDGPVVWGEKEQQEQQLVTSYICDTLQSFTENLQVSAPYTHQAGSLWHIKTDIKATLSGDWKALVNALHPTPAVCGLPKAAAYQFILNNEGYDRKFYAGYLGEWNKNFTTFKAGDCDLYVNLRCMQWEKDRVALFVGCGINKGSNPELEFLETVNKAATVKRAL